MIRITHINYILENTTVEQSSNFVDFINCASRICLSQKCKCQSSGFEVVAILSFED